MSLPEGLKITLELTEEQARTALYALHQKANDSAIQMVSFAHKAEVNKMAGGTGDAYNTLISDQKDFEEHFLSVAAVIESQLKEPSDVTT